MTQKRDDDRQLSVQFSPFTDLSITTAESVSPQGLDVWLLDLTTITPEDSEKFLTLLSQDELERARQFKLKQHNFIATRALLRKALSRYTHLEPGQLIFSRAIQGKPFLVNTPLPLYFNLSHSWNYAVLAVSSAGDLGVDIESKRERSYLKIADRFFHEHEKEHITRCDPAHREQLFYKLWTLKEAFFKALGTGISYGLHKACFHLQDHNITVQFADDLSAEINQWQFHQAIVTHNTVAAFAVKSTMPLEIHWFDASLLLT